MISGPSCVDPFVHTADTDLEHTLCVHTDSCSHTWGGNWSPPVSSRDHDIAHNTQTPGCTTTHPKYLSTRRVVLTHHHWHLLAFSTERHNDLPSLSTGQQDESCAYSGPPSEHRSSPRNYSSHGEVAEKIGISRSTISIIHT